MFTGIVAATGTLARSEARGGDLRLVIAAPTLDLADIALGDSISVSGCCLTVVAIDGDTLAFDVSTESLSLTTLGGLRAGDAVNLEKALRLADRLGGHLVSGHVDGIGTIVAITPDARSQRWSLEAPRDLARYIAAKGSVCMDGVSLTVNAIDGARVEVNLIPHTVAVTTLRDRRVGDRVNLEVDLLARYLERLRVDGPHPNPPPHAGEGDERAASPFLPPLAGDGARRTDGGDERAASPFLPPLAGEGARRADGGDDRAASPCLPPLAGEGARRANGGDVRAASPFLPPLAREGARRADGGDDRAASPCLPPLAGEGARRANGGDANASGSGPRQGDHQ